MSRAIAGKVSDLPPGKLQKVSVDGKEILVVNINGDYFAVDDTCTHSGASLSEGKLDGSSVICGWHGAQFDCKTGSLKKFPAKINNLQSYRVSIESDDVVIEV
jgi:nitrite reductase/ring-hydroxylating ferredoxin subunit